MDCHALVFFQFVVKIETFF